MAESAALHSELATLDSRNQRILIFIRILMLLNVPFLALAIVDLANTPLPLVRTTCSMILFGIYYVLWRNGNGVVGTYITVSLLPIIITFSIHDIGGVLVAGTIGFVLVMISGGTVLRDVRLLDLACAICLAAIAALGWYELTIQPPPVFGQVYARGMSLPVVTVLVVVAVTMLGSWAIIRSYLANLGTTIGALHRAQRLAQRNADELSVLAGQLQQQNTALQEAEARLQATVDALMVPLIPLGERVALMALVGHLDQQRAAQVVQTLLEGIYRRRFATVIIDITGVRDVGPEIGHLLTNAVQGGRLVGSDIIVSGMSASAALQLAQTDGVLTGLRIVGRVEDALRDIYGHDRNGRI